MKCPIYMELEEVFQIISAGRKEGKKEIIIGIDVNIKNQNLEELPYIWIDLENNIIKMTTDGTDLIDNLEVLSEELHKLGILRFEVNSHLHEGESHDKDISFQVKDDKKISAVISYFIKKSKANLDYSFK